MEPLMRLPPARSESGGALEIIFRSSSWDEQRGAPLPLCDLAQPLCWA